MKQDMISHPPASRLLVQLSAHPSDLPPTRLCVCLPTHSPVHYWHSYCQPVQIRLSICLFAWLWTRPSTRHLAAISLPPFHHPTHQLTFRRLHALAKLYSRGRINPLACWPTCPPTAPTHPQTHPPVHKPTDRPVVRLPVHISTHQ